MSQEGHGVGTCPICRGAQRQLRAIQKMTHEGAGLTKRHSPASANGFVVNHSHMNALVVPSFTLSMSPRMSLLTCVSCFVLLSWEGGGGRALTSEFELIRGPILLQCHDIRHRLAPAMECIRCVCSIRVWATGFAHLPFLEIPSVEPCKSGI